MLLLELILHLSIVVEVVVSQIRVLQVLRLICSRLKAVVVEGVLIHIIVFVCVELSRRKCVVAD